MKSELGLLIAEAMAVYLLVLGAHALRSRFGLAPFYALLGAITAVMSWVTDAGAHVEVAGITFVVGSTVFYTSLLLGVFVVYVFDGPQPARIAILTVAGVSILAPLAAVTLHAQMRITGQAPLVYVPTPSLRVNAASVSATVADLIFLAVMWEALGRRRFHLHLWLRVYLCLLGVMWLDVLLFATGAFFGEPDYVSIMQGTLLSRLVIATFAWPLLYVYMHWQNGAAGAGIERRPVLAILREVAHVRAELSQAQQEIERRKQAERENEKLIQELREAVARVKTLEGLLPICSGCRRIRVEPQKPAEQTRWIPLEDYVHKHTAAQFSHGLCASCIRRLYPEMPDSVARDAGEWEGEAQPPGD